MRSSHLSYGRMSSSSSSSSTSLLACGTFIKGLLGLAGLRASPQAATVARPKRRFNVTTDKQAKFATNA